MCAELMIFYSMYSNSTHLPFRCQFCSVLYLVLRSNLVSGKWISKHFCREPLVVMRRALQCSFSWLQCKNNRKHDGDASERYSWEHNNSPATTPSISAAHVFRAYSPCAEREREDIKWMNRMKVWKESRSLNIKLSVKWSGKQKTEPK